MRIEQKKPMHNMTLTVRVPATFKFTNLQLQRAHDDRHGERLTGTAAALFGRLPVAKSAQTQHAAGRRGASRRGRRRSTRPARNPQRFPPCHPEREVGRARRISCKGRRACGHENRCAQRLCRNPQRFPPCHPEREVGRARRISCKERRACGHENCCAPSAAFGDSLRSVILYGSGAEGRFRPTSDVNLLIVLSRFDGGAWRR